MPSAHTPPVPSYDQVSGRAFLLSGCSSGHVSWQMGEGEGHTESLFIIIVAAATVILILQSPILLPCLHL